MLAPVRYLLPQPFEQLDHTADLAVAVEGDTREEVLARLVLALGALLSGGGAAAPGPEERIACAGGPDACGSAVALLRELLFRFATGRVFPASCRPLRLDASGAEVAVGFARWDPALHGEGADVKAVTWHAARLEPANGGWRGQVVLDV